MTLTTLPDVLRAELDRYADEVDREDDPASLAQELVVLRELVRELRTLAEMVEARYCTIAPKKLEVAGVGLVTVKHNTKRTAWQSDEVLKRVIAAARDERRVDLETGELEDPFAAAARVIADCTSFSWRVTALRSRGIDADEFCHVEIGHPAVAIGMT